MSLKRINKHKETSTDIELGIVGTNLPNIVVLNISTATINASTKPTNNFSASIRNILTPFN